MTLYNSFGAVESDYLSWEKSTRVVIRHTGDIVFVPPVTYKGFCAFSDPETWPWGERNCTMIFGSWTYSQADLDIHARDVETYDGAIDTRYFQNKMVGPRGIR